MSLWPVSDHITREMMTDHYVGLKKGLGRGDALRQSQLAMLRRTNRRHPADVLTFDEHSYFMDVELTKTGRFPIITPFTPMPALGMIKLEAGIVCVT
jgi:CHAT domain-containing protein